MAMREAELGLRKTGDPRDAAYADVIEGILRARGKDILHPNPYNQEAVTQTFQAIWKVRQEMLRAERVDLEFFVPECPYTEEELKQLEVDGRRVGYLPKELAAQASRHLLGVLWPQMRSCSIQEGNPVTNEVDRHGWFDYEAGTNAPYLYTKEKDLRAEALNRGLEKMTLNQYIVAGQDSKLLTGKYLDQDRTRVRLLGSRDEGYVVRAYFDPDGRLDVGSFLGPAYRDGGLGGRLAGVPKTT